MKTFKQIYNIVIESSNKVYKLEEELKKAKDTLSRLKDRENKKPDDQYLLHWINETEITIKSLEHNIELLKSKDQIKETDEMLPPKEDIPIKKSTITIEEDFSDEGILALYELASKKYNLELVVDDASKVSAALSGEDKDIIKFLLKIVEMTEEDIKDKYSELDFESYKESIK